MLDKILNDNKTFKFVFLISIVILFFIVLKKNNKEKFTNWDNLQAIENLAYLTKKMVTDGKLKLEDLTVGQSNQDFSDYIVEQEVNLLAPNYLEKHNALHEIIKNMRK